MRIRALSLDLDDTLWPIWPAIERAERALEAFLQAHAPRTAERYPIPAMRELRDRIALQNPQLAHDFTAQRKLSLAHALRESEDDDAHVDAAFDAFYAERNRVELYPDAGGALARLGARWPLAALTNGNADLERIGLAGHFAAIVSARAVGAAKPEPAIFHHACERLDCAPQELLHVGDDPWLDVAGAQGVGAISCWINRSGADWPESLPRPDLEFAHLHALADWLDAQAVRA
jgi:putative hydrolase of the HAD superfamily